MDAGVLLLFYLLLFLKPSLHSTFFLMAAERWRMWFYFIRLDTLLSWKKRGTQRCINQVRKKGRSRYTWFILEVGNGAALSNIYTMRKERGNFSYCFFCRKEFVQLKLQSENVEPRESPLYVRFNGVQHVVLSLMESRNMLLVSRY